MSESAAHVSRGQDPPHARGFQPYVPADESPPELTWSSVLLGTILGVVFGASSLYLFLKVGMTVSASIPVAVLSITILRQIARALGDTAPQILKNNIVQTAGSAGESIAFGVGAAMPALMILGYELEWSRVLLVAVLGGLLGILMMIPLRRAFIVNQHGTLPYPEGTACAKVLIAGEEGGSSAKTVFLGFGVGFAYKILQGLKLWAGDWAKPITGISGYKNAEVALEADPALLGVGYIIGPRIASVMVAGGILTSLLLIPLITYFGEHVPTVLEPAKSKLVGDMHPGDIKNDYVKYIGAGAVAMGGILSMINALPLIIGSLVGSMRSLGGPGEKTQLLRTERDIPMPLVILGTLLLVGAMAASPLIPTQPMGRVIGGAMVVLFGFLFVTVSSRITGVIGSSSNPISGMTIATLLLTCLIFVVLGWVGPEYRLVAISIAGVVCIASSNGGTISQDLKTGYLVGATPWKQQVAILVGALVSALMMGGTLLWLNNAFTTITDRPEELPKVAAPVDTLDQTDVGLDGKTYKVWWVTNTNQGAEPGKYLVDPTTGEAKYLIDPGIGGRLNYTTSGNEVKKFNPPQPRLFATIIDGIMSRELPWGLVILGAVLAIVMQLAGVSALAFAVGVYLPLSTTLPIFIGGLIRALVDRALKLSNEESEMSSGTLMATGLIAGGSLAGIITTLFVAVEALARYTDFSKLVQIPVLVPFGLLMAALLGVGLIGHRSGEQDPKPEDLGLPPA